MPAPSAPPARAAGMRSAAMYCMCGALLVACAAYDGRDLVVGQATEAAVIARMGMPADRHTLPDGSRQLVFPRGPLGLHTFVAHLDADGRLVRIENVLDDRHFASIIVGESRRDEVRRRLGPPAEVLDFPRRQEQTWDYRFLDAWGRTARFVVVFDAAGIVRQTFQHEEYRNDGLFDAQ